jgi:acetyl-CoA acetyltransferase
MAGVGPDEVQFAQIQDPYSIQVVLQLEDCGLCAPGEGASFVEDGQIGLGGRLPVNTDGGQLSHGYLLAMTHVIEAVRQLRGECGTRQVVDAELGLVSGFGPGESTVLLLERG